MAIAFWRNPMYCPAEVWQAVGEKDSIVLPFDCLSELNSLVPFLDSAPAESKSVLTTPVHSSAHISPEIISSSESISQLTCIRNLGTL